MNVPSQRPPAEIAPPTEPVALELAHLSKSYGGPPVLVDVTLEVPPGCIFGYLGPNGAGKTTTLKVAAGLLKPSAGDVIVCGSSITSQPLDAKARLGFLPESGALFEKLTPREYLEFVAVLYDLPATETAGRVDRWLDFFDLRALADQRMTTFSKGQKQRVCWASVLLHEPRVLLLDEPLNGLDVESVRRVKELMHAVAAEGRTIFYSSHLVDVVEKLCQRLAVLHGGHIVATGTPEEIVIGSGADSLEEAMRRLGGEWVR